MTWATSDESDATRARDADREKAVDLVDAAYSDGQLSAAEREDRSDRVVAATTLGELRALTGDLQAPAIYVGPRRVRRGRVAVISAAIVAVAVIVGVAVAGGDDEEPTVRAPSAEMEKSAAAEPTSEPAPSEKETKPLRYSFTASGVRDFIKLYRKEFATTKATAFGFSPEQVIIARHGDTGQAEMWGYVDGHFVDDGYYSERDFEAGTIDIAKLDVEAAFRNLARVKRRVGDAKPRYFGMTVVVSGGKKGVWLAAGDDTACEADWMTLDGKVRERGTPCPTGN